MTFPIRTNINFLKDHSPMITEPGKITERITFLGRFDSCVYVVDGGDESVLIGGGLSCLVPDILGQLKAFDIEEEKIKKLLILHAHFDHCGIIPYFKKRWPWAKVIASGRAKQTFSDARISQIYSDLNLEALSQNGLKDQAEKEGFLFTGVNVDHVVGEGDILSCGDLTLEVIDAPGHSSCSIAVYIPQEKALFPSDSAGVCYGAHFQPAANSNYDYYQQTLDRLVRYDVDAILPEHFGAAVGEEARNYLPRAIEAAKKERAMMEDSYRRTRDIDKSTEEIMSILVDKAPAPFISHEIMAAMVGQTLKFIASKMMEE
jgi:glyoxylase-like metal-dependent hydrolase (beta-lactamase superfamily II)